MSYDTVDEMADVDSIFDEPGWLAVKLTNGDTAFLSPAVQRSIASRAE